MPGRGSCSPTAARPPSAESGGQLTVTDEQAAQTTGQWLSPTTFQAWDEDGAGRPERRDRRDPVERRQRLDANRRTRPAAWPGRGSCSPAAAVASIAQVGGQLVLTNEQGQQTTAQWLTARPRSRRGARRRRSSRTAPSTQIVWDGNTWTQSPLQVERAGRAVGRAVQRPGRHDHPDRPTSCILTNEQGTQTVAQWVSPTTFEAWGYTAQVVQRQQHGHPVERQHLDPSRPWQAGALGGKWLVQSNGMTATIVQTSGQLAADQRAGLADGGAVAQPRHLPGLGPDRADRPERHHHAAPVGRQHLAPVGVEVGRGGSWQGGSRRWAAGAAARGVHYFLRSVEGYSRPAKAAGWMRRLSSHAGQGRPPTKLKPIWRGPDGTITGAAAPGEGDGYGHLGPQPLPGLRRPPGSAARSSANPARPLSAPWSAWPDTAGKSTRPAGATRSQRPRPGLLTWAGTPPSIGTPRAKSDGETGLTSPLLARL